MDLWMSSGYGVKSFVKEKRPIDKNIQTLERYNIAEKKTAVGINIR